MLPDLKLIFRTYPCLRISSLGLPSIDCTGATRSVRNRCAHVGGPSPAVVHTGSLRALGEQRGDTGTTGGSDGHWARFTRHGFSKYGNTGVLLELKTNPSGVILLSILFSSSEHNVWGTTCLGRRYVTFSHGYQQDTGDERLRMN